jgi:hypothetical protein
MPSSESNSRWDELARYNTEKHRGIIHTKEYDARMAIEQEQFNMESNLDTWNDDDEGGTFMFALLFMMLLSFWVGVGVASLVWWIAT